MVDFLYSYVMTHDTGFAPNPYHGVCTLACCKPVIRKGIANYVIRKYKEKYNKSTTIDEVRKASNGEFIKSLNIWVVATAGKKLRDECKNIQKNSIVYLMQVTDIQTFSEYCKYNKKRSANVDAFFSESKSETKNLLHINCGDNIYIYDEQNQTYDQQSSFHQRTNGKTDQDMYDHDISGKYVLLSENYIYYGIEATVFSETLYKYVGQKIITRANGAEIINSLSKKIKEEFTANQKTRKIMGRPIGSHELFDIQSKIYKGSELN